MTLLPLIFSFALAASPGPDTLYAVDLYGSPATAPRPSPMVGPGPTDRPRADGLQSPPGQPRRQTRRFARYGALAGGATGLLAGSWMALYCAGTSSGGCFGALPLLTGLGIVSGGTAGAIIGASIPGPGAAAGSAPIASASLSMGAAHARIGQEEGHVSAGGGTVARLNVYARLRPWLGLGPELGLASFGDAGDVRHIAVAARVTRGSGRIQPFVTANLGAYDSTAPSLEYFGGGIGVGARVNMSAADRFFVDVEGRHSRNTQNIEPMRMQSVSLSGGLYW